MSRQTTPPSTGRSAAVPVFDGHNDVLLRLHTSGFADPVAAFLDGVEHGGQPRGQLDLPRATAAAMIGGLYAIFVPSRGATGGAAALVDAPDSPPASEVDRPAARPWWKKIRS